VASTALVFVAVLRNVAIRGMPLVAAGAAANLAAIVGAAQKRNVAVLVLGMEAPPNFGAVYIKEFRAVYAQVAADLDVPLVPFFLEGVAGVGRLNQADGIHPTAEGQQRIADTIWRSLEPLVRAQTS